MDLQRQISKIVAAIMMPAAVIIGMSCWRVTQPLSPQKLVTKTIDHHDPQAVWKQGVFSFKLEESRPQKAARFTSIIINNRRGTFELTTERDGRKIEIHIDGQNVKTLLDGSVTFTAAEAKQYYLKRDRALWLRNYYLYLYGMPMKLLDEGARFAEKLVKTDFNNREALELRVTYDKEVGDHTWYFYFDPTDHALIGYRYYKDEVDKDGEYVILHEEALVGKIRLPKVRRWYSNKDGRYLGMDTIVR